MHNFSQRFKLYCYLATFKHTFFVTRHMSGAAFGPDPITALALAILSEFTQLFSLTSSSPPALHCDLCRPGHYTALTAVRPGRAGADSTETSPRGRPTRPDPVTSLKRDLPPAIPAAVSAACPGGRRSGWVGPSGRACSRLGGRHSPLSPSWALRRRDGLIALHGTAHNQSST